MCVIGKGTPGTDRVAGLGGVPRCDWQAAEDLGFAPRTELDLVQG